MQFGIEDTGKTRIIPIMSSREIAIDLIKKLPENTSLQEIAHEIEFLAGLQQAEEESDRGEGAPAEEVFKLIDSWASR
jgi:hypothetical protein